MMYGHLYPTNGLVDKRRSDLPTFRGKPQFEYLVCWEESNKRTKDLQNFNNIWLPAELLEPVLIDKYNAAVPELVRNHVESAVTRSFNYGSLKTSNGRNHAGSDDAQLQKPLSAPGYLPSFSVSSIPAEGGTRVLFKKLPANSLKVSGERDTKKQAKFPEHSGQAIDRFPILWDSQLTLGRKAYRILGYIINTCEHQSPLGLHFLVEYEDKKIPSREVVSAEICRKYCPKIMGDYLDGLGISRIRKE